MPWALKWRSENRLDGKYEYIMWQWWTGGGLYKTRQEARAALKKEWGYLQNRPDLQREPHGWKMPKVVKVKMSAIEVKP